jgi:hypothetical protein
MNIILLFKAMEELIEMGYGDGDINEDGNGGYTITDPTGLILARILRIGRVVPVIY